MSPRLCVVLLACSTLLGQKYSGPKPEKPDLLYLVHADNLIPTEVSEAKEETRKDDILYVIPGASSTARTPMASPIFIVDAQQLAAEKIELYRLESRNGRREILFSRKKKRTARPLRLSMTRLADKLYRIEVDESLQVGEYSLTPSGSNQVFAFQVF
jgi:hypothetical protein